MTYGEFITESMFPYLALSYGFITIFTRLSKYYSNSLEIVRMVSIGLTDILPLTKCAWILALTILLGQDRQEMGLCTTYTFERGGSTHHPGDGSNATSWWQNITEEKVKIRF
jgi:hypothetical protein